MKILIIHNAIVQSSNQKVDFMIEYKAAIEIKSANLVQDKHLKGLKTL